MNGTSSGVYLCTGVCSNANGDGDCAYIIIVK